MVATLHPQVATITPQYAVPFTLSCAAGRPALVEQTAAVLVIPSLDCVTNGVSLVYFFFYFFLFVFVVFFCFYHFFFFFIQLSLCRGHGSMCHLVAVFLLHLWCLIVFLPNICRSTVWLWCSVWLCKEPGPLMLLCQPSVMQALTVVSEEHQRCYLCFALLPSDPRAWKKWPLVWLCYRYLDGQKLNSLAS